MRTPRRYLILEEVRDERRRQDDLWGEQNHPDGTGGETWASNADNFRALCDLKHKMGQGTWLDILLEEAFEASAEDDPDKLRAELIQVAAVATAWVEAIDRRTK